MKTQQKIVTVTWNYIVFLAILAKYCLLAKWGQFNSVHLQFVCIC